MKEVIGIAIREALVELGVAELDFVVEHPAELSHGDYASNAALGGQIEYVEKIDIAGPGFLNFHLSRDFFTTAVSRASETGAAWGRSDALKDELILFEYTSPNLFKPLHIGNLVGNIIGESCTRLAEFSGATVKRINYPSDIGLTVAKGVWGLQATGGEPGDIAALGAAYQKGNEAYEAGGAEKDAIDAVNQALYTDSDATLSALRRQGIATSKARLDELCRMLGTVFDTVITESEASGPGTDIVKEHIGDVFVESDGAVVYQGEKVGLHTRVFLNSKGLPTYEAKDLGNFVRKRALYPEWTQSIIVTGNEQAEYFKVLYAAIKELFPEARERSLEHIPTGFLTLTTGKMSSRKGNVLTGESLLEEMTAVAHERAAEARTDDINALTEAVAVAALKYQILRHNVGSNIIFDKEKALSFEGDSGPYVQYTHARIVSVLEKAAAVGVCPDIQLPPPQPYDIERILYRFPEVVAAAWRERAPHKVAGFLIELAGTFNTFYANERIADPSDPHAPYKATIADAVCQTLKNGLFLLGIRAPEKM